MGDVVGVGPFRNSCGTCEFCIKKWTNCCEDVELLYGTYYGGYSTHIQLNESHVFLLPKNLDPKTAGPIMCAGITTFLPLHLYAKKGDRVAILGCGGLGHMAI